MQSEWKTLKMLIPVQTPCFLHPVSQARPHPWGYYQITLWTAYKEQPQQKGVNSEHQIIFLKDACGHSGVEVQTDRQTSALQLPSFNGSLTKQTLTLGLRRRVCSKGGHENPICVNCTCRQRVPCQVRCNSAALKLSEGESVTIKRYI